MYNVEIEPGAVEDIDKACRYYLSLLVDTDRLINHFLDDLQTGLDNLKINPNFNFKTKKYRALPLNKFPYIIIFTVDDVNKMVFILALFHTAQNPKKYPS